jgi:choline monooxygenase
VAEFDPAVPLEAAVTPPSGWYTDADFLRLELDRVFLRGWQAVGINNDPVPI